MNRNEIDELVEKYPLDPNIAPDTSPWTSQYDCRSASINYALVRHFKPKVVVEFGTRGGRCTHDILKALKENGDDYIFKPYEISDGLRGLAKENLQRVFSSDIPEIGKDIMEADDLPDNIEYVFVDNCHDRETTEWVFNTLIKKCKPGCLVHFHDMSIHKDFEIALDPHGEIVYIVELHKQGKLPLEKLYWTYEEGEGRSSTWWTLKP